MKFDLSEPPHMIHGDINDASPGSFPTHTHGLDEVDLPELFINAQAFGVEDNAKVINDVVFFLLQNEKEYEEVQERKVTVEVQLWGEDELTLCIRPVDLTFGGVLSAYSSVEQRKDLIVSQLYVKGDDFVLDSKYYQWEWLQ